METTTTTTTKKLDQINAKLNSMIESNYEIKDKLTGLVEINNRLILQNIKLCNELKLK